MDRRIDHTRADQPVGAGGLTASYPADSITLLVIPRGAGTTTTTSSSTAASSSSTSVATTTTTGAAPITSGRAGGSGSSTGQTVLATTSTTQATRTRSVVSGSATPRRLTQAQKLARAIRACHRLRKRKRSRCVAAARRRYSVRTPRKTG